jgi:hypothetical protein
MAFKIVQQRLFGKLYNVGCYRYRLFHVNGNEREFIIKDHIGINLSFFQRMFDLHVFDGFIGQCFSVETTNAESVSSRRCTFRFTQDFKIVS